MNAQVKQKRSIILLAAVVINFLLGTVYAWSEFKIVLVKQYGWSMNTIKPPFILMIMMFVVATIIGGRIQDKFKPHLVCLVGSVLFGLGYVLSGFTQDFKTILVTFGLISGLGMGLCFSTTIPTVMKWQNHKHAGLFIGLIVSGLGLAPLYMDLFTNSLLAVFNLKYSFILLGVTCTVLLALLSLVLKNPPQDFKKEIDATSTSSGLASNGGLNTIIKSKYFLRILLIIFLSSFASLLVIDCLGSVARAQISWDAGFRMVIIIAISSFIGRILGGFIFDRIGFKKTLLLFLFVQIINLLLFWSYSNIGFMIIGASLTGLSYGGFFTIFLSTIFKHSKINNLGLNLGLLLAGWGVAVVLNSMIIKKFVTPVGTLNIPHILALIFLLISIYMAKFITYFSESEQVSD